MDVKLKCAITWSDETTDANVRRIATNAINALSYKLGCEPRDFFEDGQARSLLLNYALYEWNNALDLYDDNYKNDIGQCRAYYEVVHNAD